MTNPYFETIQKTIADNPVVVFMKGTAERPQCGFSGLVVQILQRMGVAFTTVDVLADESMRQAIKDFSDWPTIPQLYIQGEFIGGSDITRELYVSGELKTILENKNIPFHQVA